MVDSDASSVCDDFESLSLSRRRLHSASSDPDVPGTDYVDGYENPIAWHKKHNIRSDLLPKDVLFDNKDMRNITLAQYGVDDMPEYVKWKLLGYNIVICYEYYSKNKMDKAFKIIGDIENILSSIGSNDPFLKSIKVALNHIVFSMKGHIIFRLGLLETMVLEHFVMPNNMNNINKAGLFGFQTLFFYEYGLPCAHIAKENALKAIALNDTEAEWYFLMARVLTHWQRTCGNYFECSEQEIHASEMAVQLGNKDHHKLHLIHIYHRMSKNMKQNESYKAEILKTGLKLLNEVMYSTNDILLLKNCLLSLSKISLDKYNNVHIQEILEKLINKLESSDNGYVHGAIGNYYLFNKKDYKRANFHLKKAHDVKSFGSSIDYIYTFFKMDPDTAPVEQMMVDLLKSFSHPVHREKILSQIVSYLMITKNDLIRALKYVPMLLSIKNVTSIYSLQTHRVKFTLHHMAINLIDTLARKLDAASNDPKLPADHKKRVTEVLQLFEPYTQYVLNLMKEKEHIFGDNFKKINKTKNNPSVKNNNEQKELWTYKNYKVDNMSNVNNKDEVNWRTLKPDPNPKPHVFSRGYQKHTSDNGMEIRTRLNFKK